MFSLFQGTEGNLDPHETLQALLRDPKLSGLLAGKPSEVSCFKQICRDTKFYLIEEMKVRN